MHTTRYQRLGVPSEWVTPDSIVARFTTFVQQSLEKPANYYVRHVLVTNSIYTSSMYLYQDDHLKAKDWAVKILPFMEDYFFGPWQDLAPTGEKRELPPDRNWWLSNLTWKDDWEGCLAWGSALGEWDKLTHLATYFRDGVGGDMEQTWANYYWHLLVAGVLTGRPESELAPYREKIAAGKGREKREQLLLAFLDAIRRGSDEELVAASSEYFKHYLKTDAKKKEVLAPLMFDGSFLVHFAKRAGRTVPIPENIQDHLIAL